MDDYESWSQEDEETIPEAEAQVSYLDDDDVQLREPEVDNSNKLDSSAMDFEEELAKLRKLCKGIDLLFSLRPVSYRFACPAYHLQFTDLQVCPEILQPD